MEHSILPSDDHKALSEAYYCPITMSLMKHPVIGPEGYSFEKDAIEQWIDKNEVSPLTRAPLPSKRLLYPNLALKEMLKVAVVKLREEDQTQSLREYKLSLMDEEARNKEEEGQQLSYNGPRTLEDWKALRHRRRQSNAQLTCNGGLQFLYFVLVLVLGVVGIVMGTLALILATVVDLLVAPIVQCFYPGGCHGDSDPFGDDEVPFIVYHYSDDGSTEEH